jgi:hypothetical protein
MRIEDDGVVEMTVVNTDGTEVRGRVPVYEAFHAYLDIAQAKPDGTAFWAAWCEYLAQFGLVGISHRAAQLVHRQLGKVVEGLEKKDQGSPSAS